MILQFRSYLEIWPDCTGHLAGGEGDAPGTALRRTAGTQGMVTVMMVMVRIMVVVVMVQL